MYTFLVLAVGVFLGYRFRDRIQALKRQIWDDQIAG